MNKTDAYDEFDPTQTQGACVCTRVGFDLDTLTWKEKKSPTVDPCADVKAQLAQAQADLAQAQSDKAQVEAQLAETQSQLDACKSAQCPEVTVMSIGDEVVFTGTSCDTMTSLGDESVTGVNYGT